MLQGLDAAPKTEYQPFFDITPAGSDDVIKGIAVLGSHPETVAKAPFDDPEWMIMACSPHNIEQRTLPRVDCWVECHLPIQDKTRSFRYLDKLKELPCPVLMRDTENMGAFPNAELYPEHAMKSKFGPFFFTSSIAFMLALAIDECQRKDYKRIGLWGIMQASANEFTYQRPGIQALIWEAIRNGIDVLAPEESRLFEPQPEQF